jgi:serine/threonine protein kinase
MSSQKYRNAIPIGEKIGGYRIEKILGQGGFGITYLAKDEKLDRYLAIKEYFPTEFSKREENGAVYPQSVDEEEVYEWGLERFLNEGKTLAKFKHPNIVRFIDYLEENNTAYIIMEYEHGNDLSTILKERKSLSSDEILKIFLPLLDGLALVHQAGFIHRDIKPANIFIREDGSPVLIDFGSARQGLATKTKTLTTLVSPGYAPFEQYNTGGTSKQGPWTDIYALGASMYKTLFGRSPLDAVSRAEERVAGRDDPYMTATYVGKDHYPLQILETIDKALAFLPDDRPQTIENWISILKSVDANMKNQEDDEETIKIDTPDKEEVNDNNDDSSQASRLEDTGLKLAITKYIVIGMLTFWSYTSYTLSSNLIKFSTSISSINIDNRSKFLFSGIYALILLLVLSWIVPNVFMGYLFEETYMVRVILISALLFYGNTVAFVLWYMKQIKKIDVYFLDEQIKHQTMGEEKTREAKNAMVTKWEGIDNHVVLFLVISIAIIFFPYVCAKLFFNITSQYLVLVLPIIVMFLGGLFHVWGTRLLINTYNNTLIK